jgi:hypothetical protein
MENTPGVQGARGKKTGSKSKYLQRKELLEKNIFEVDVTGFGYT